MAKSGLTLKVDFKDRDGFLPMLKKATLANTSRIMRLVSLRMRKMQIDHFAQQKDSRGRSWKPLEKSTLKARRTGGKSGRSGKILQDDGLLKNSIVASSTADKAEVGTNKIYAATHQFGRDAIPAREFIYISDSEGTVLAKMIGDEMFRWMKNK